MIPNGEGWHYLTVKKLPVLLRRITLKHGAFLLLELPSFFKKKNLNHIKKCVKIKVFVISFVFWRQKILEVNKYWKSDKEPFIIYADLECLIEKSDGFKYSPEKSFTTNVSKHIQSSFPMCATSSFKNIEKKHGKW